MGPDSADMKLEYPQHAWCFVVVERSMVLRSSRTQRAFNVSRKGLYCVPARAAAPAKAQLVRPGHRASTPGLPGFGCDSTENGGSSVELGPCPVCLGGLGTFGKDLKMLVSTLLASVSDPSQTSPFRPRDQLTLEPTFAYVSVLVLLWTL